MRFNDDDYDGIVVKLPMGFIVVNKLDKMLKNWLSDLKQCQFSLLMSEYERSLNELENYKDKIAIIKDKEQQEEKEKLVAEEYRKDYHRKLLVKEIVETQWEKERDGFQYDTLDIGGNILKYREIVTKSGIKNKYKKMIVDYIKLPNFKLIDFAANNCNAGLSCILRGNAVVKLDLDTCPVYVNTYGEFGINYDRCYKGTSRKLRGLAPQMN